MLSWSKLLLIILLLLLHLVDYLYYCINDAWSNKHQKQIITFRNFANALKNVSKFLEKIDMHFIFSTFFFRKSCHLWDNVEKYCDRGRPQMTIWRMRNACWIPRATNTHWVCVILIAFPLKLWLHERASELCYKYSACLVYSKTNE